MKPKKISLLAVILVIACAAGVFVYSFSSPTLVEFFDRDTFYTKFSIRDSFIKTLDNGVEETHVSYSDSVNQFIAAPTGFFEMCYSAKNHAELIKQNMLESNEEEKGLYKNIEVTEIDGKSFDCYKVSADTYVTDENNKKIDVTYDRYFIADGYFRFEIQAQYTKKQKKAYNQAINDVLDSLTYNATKFTGEATVTDNTEYTITVPDNYYSRSYSNPPIFYAHEYEASTLQYLSASIEVAPLKNEKGLNLDDYVNTDVLNENFNSRYGDIQTAKTTFNGDEAYQIIYTRSNSAYDYVYDVYYISHNSKLFSIKIGYTKGYEEPHNTLIKVRNDIKLK